MSYNITYNSRILFFPANITTTTTTTTTIILDFVVIVVKYCEEIKVSLHLRCSVTIIGIVIVIDVIVNAGWYCIVWNDHENIIRIEFRHIKYNNDNSNK